MQSCLRFIIDVITKSIWILWFIQSYPIPSVLRWSHKKWHPHPTATGTRLHWMMFHLAQLFRQRIVTRCQSLLRQAKEVQHSILHDPLGAPHNVAKKTSDFQHFPQKMFLNSCKGAATFHKKNDATKSLAQRAKDSRNLCHWVQEVSSTLLGSDSNHDKESPSTAHQIDWTSLNHWIKTQICYQFWQPLYLSNQNASNTKCQCNLFKTLRHTPHTSQHVTSSDLSIIWAPVSIGRQKRGESCQSQRLMTAAQWKSSLPWLSWKLKSMSWDVLTLGMEHDSMIIFCGTCFF